MEYHLARDNPEMEKSGAKLVKQERLQVRKSVKLWVQVQGGSTAFLNFSFGICR